LSRPFSPRSYSPPASFTRVNGKIRAREVRVIDDGQKNLGVMPLGEAINLARAKGVDLVEIAAGATPPVCRLVDFGKYRYELAKQEKEARKHQHANKVKEIQLSPNIDPHDFAVKLQHATNFLCEDMKVKITLRFRGREMAHKEFGFQQVERLVKALTPFAHPDAPAKLIGKGINVMLSPLPRSKRARNPHTIETADLPPPEESGVTDDSSESDDAKQAEQAAAPPEPLPPAKEPSSQTFGNNAFANLEIP
jgi:translation initiation factor IF-3